MKTTDNRKIEDKKMKHETVREFGTELHVTVDADKAAEALRRQRFAKRVAGELAALRNDTEAWEHYVAQADDSVGDDGA